MPSHATAEKRAQAALASAALAKVPGVKGILLFGSVAREQAKVGSDVDLLVLGDDDELSPSKLRQRLPRSLSKASISLTYHTSTTLRNYLHQWTRFGFHLRKEGIILYDAHGELRDILSVDIPVSLAPELHAQERYLANYDHPERFGGRFLFPLAHVYRIGRATVFAALAHDGKLEFDRETAFNALADAHPDLREDIKAIEILAPFHDQTRHPGSKADLPFDPAGQAAESHLIAARAAISRILSFASIGDGTRD